LRGAASVTIMVAGGQVWRASGQEVSPFGTPAYEPWKSWRGDAKDGALALVRAAVISSNAYNAQP
jgi:hypothetical protein